MHFNSQAEQTIQSDVPSGEMHFNNASQAEQTIQSEINRERPLVKGADGKQYPKNPVNGYTSQIADGFHGCLGCGETNHRFRECSRRNEKAVRERFWQELWAHVPSTRKREMEAVSTPDTAKRVPLPPTSQLSYQTGKHPRLFAIFACVSNLTSTSQKPMPIAICCKVEVFRKIMFLNTLKHFWLSLNDI